MFERGLNDDRIKESSAAKPKVTAKGFTGSATIADQWEG